MATYSEQLQRVWHQYEKENDRQPATAREVVSWGVAKGLIALPELDPYGQLSEDMARALREEYRTDSSGRRYRANHAVKITKGGVQLAIWADMETAPRSHMEKAFAQRRVQIVGDAYQLRVDVDAYNHSRKGEPPIQLVLDFTPDVEELLHVDEAA
jgi:hypothetical protein